MMQKLVIFLGQLSSVFFGSRKAAFISSIFGIAVLALLYIAYRQVEESAHIELPTGQAAIKISHPSPGLLTASQEVLVLSSYHVGHAWSDNEIAGIIEIFREASANISYDIEYLDCKRHPKYEHFEKVKDLFKLKYGNRNIPVIIVADNPALEFALKYRSLLFPRSSIVFCGVNNYKKEMLGGQENITGLAEALDADDTMRIALKLHPKTREVLVVHDFTSTGLATRREAEEQMKGMFDRVSFRYVEDVTKKELTQLLKGLPEDSLVLALAYNVFKDGEVITHEDVARLLSANSPVPVYGVHRERLGYGIVGGSLLSGRIHGAQAARVALKILSGAPSSTIPVDMNPPTRMMFDYNQLVRFGIPMKALPEGSVIVNRPISFISSHKYLVVSTLLVIVILTSGIIILGFNMYRREFAEDALRKSKEELEMRVSDRTAELENANEQMQFELTERKKAEEALQKSEQRLQLHVRQTPLAVIEWDTGFHVVGWNPAAEKIFGYSAAEALGRHAEFIVPVSARPHVDRVWGELLLRKGGERSTNENITKDGGTILCEWYNTPLITAGGSVIGVASLVQDITERKRAEDEIRRSSREWSAAMDASEDIVYLLDQDRRVLRANKAFYTMTRSSPETAIGKHIVELVHPGGEKVLCPLCLAQEEKRDLVFIMESDHPDNPAGRPIEIALRMVRDDEGRPISMLMTLHDLTHDRKVQEELTKYREHLEELVKTRTAELEKKNAELEKINKLFVGRELRMAELKGKITELEKQTGSSSR